ncbi:hypothetical protein COOONC_04046 [Cooperia oncophora]
MMSGRQLLFAAVVALSSSLNPVESRQDPLLPLFDSIIRLPFLSSASDAEVERGVNNIREVLQPFFEKAKNASQASIIAEKPSAEEANAHNVTTTTNSSSIDSELELYRFRLRKALAKLKAVTKKQGKYSELKKAARKVCFKEARGPTTRTKCMVKLLEAELSYHKWKKAHSKKKETLKKKDIGSSANRETRTSKRMESLNRLQASEVKIYKPDMIPLYRKGKYRDVQEQYIPTDDDGKIELRTLKTRNDKLRTNVLPYRL